MFKGYGPMCCVTDLMTWMFIAFVLLPGVCGSVVPTGWETFSFGDNAITETASKLNLLPDDVQEANLVAVATFQTCWCMEQYWMQVWAIHIVRNNKVPFLQCWSAPILVVTTLLALAFGTLVSFTPIGEAMGMVRLPWYAVAFMPFIGLTYFVIANLAKRRTLRRYGYFAC